ncbi:kinesin-like protein KIF28P [Littorina saxatilis]|uniref:kinesin-like protein KIF28P n=1 Tax=Littorina saxatilis TaxID=31220 RepID=UPI0038B4F7BA
MKVLDINMKFEVEIGKKRSNILCVRATDKDLDMEWVWSKAEFEQRRQTMDELYDQLLATDRMPALGQKNSPFYDSHQPDTCLGRNGIKQIKCVIHYRCSVSLHNITYHLPVEDDVPVKDSGGKQVATVHISMMPCTSKGEPLLAQGDTLQDPTEVMDKELNLRLAVSSFRDVHWAASNRQRGIYCKVWMEGEEEVLRTETVLGAVNGKFHNKFHFAFDAVTTSLFKFFCTQGLQLELWGTQGAAGSTSSVPRDSSRQSSTDSVKNGKDGGLVLDLTLAQDLRHFFRNIGPVRHKLRTLRDHAIENSKAQEVRLQSWADCSSQLQAAEEELNNCVLSLKESVKIAIQRSKQS